MEAIYMKGFLGRREWCSDKIHIKSYFDKFTEALSGISSKRSSEINILQQCVPQSNQLLQEELSQLENIMNPLKLTTLFDEDMHDLKLQCLKKQDSSSYSTEEETSSRDVLHPSIVSGTRIGRKSDRIKSGRVHVTRREVLLDAAENKGLKNIVPHKDFLVSFRIHEPFCHTIGDNSRPGRCTQQINVLGHQPLTALKDKIVCESDFQDTRGDMSEHPNMPDTAFARDSYFSSMFYFDNTFYTDNRNKTNWDYSEPIKEWGIRRAIPLGETLPMHSTEVGDLNIRFGYPYLYLHQGCCEHIIIISDARLVTTKDSLCSNDYPLMTKVSHNNLIYCMTCSHDPAKWIVRGSDRLAHDPTYQCRDCFKALHYINGKKVGKFKAYEYRQRSTIL